MLRSTPWPQLGLELVVVVLGILLALGIDSWWAERNDRALERAILSQLSKDLSRADGQLSEQLALTEEAAQAAVNLTDAAQGGRGAPVDSVASWLIRVSWWSDPVPTTATAQGILSSNSLHLIRSEALRSALVSFLDQVRQMESRIPRHEEEIGKWMGAVNELVNPLSRGHTVHVGMLDEGVEADVGVAVAGDLKEDLVDVLGGDRFQLAALNLFYAHENLRWLQAHILEVTQSLREEVEMELARSR